MSKLKKCVFEGAATAIITPFKNGEIDYSAMRDLIERQVDKCIDAIVVAGTTGEASTLTGEEHKSLIRFTVETVNGRVPVIAGTGSNDISHGIEMSKYACSVGCDALLIITPYYNKATPQGLIKSFLAYADAVTKPMIVYNVPSRTGCNIPISVYREISKHENIVATKEASGNVSAIAQIIDELSDTLDVYSGNDDQILPILSLGGRGVISVLSNIIPHEVHTLCKAFFEGRIDLCRELQLKYLRLINSLFSEVNPIPVKHACNLMNLCSNEMRLPMCEMEPAGLQSLKAVMHQYSLIP